MTIRDLRAGQSAVVVHTGGTGLLKRRLCEMGLTPGVRVRVRKRAPLGDPIELHLRGYELTIRREEAERITVSRSAPSARAYNSPAPSPPSRRPPEERPARPAGLPARRSRALGLAGNPNCGKTTLFNALTGSSQHVGNWPGVTVAKKSGRTLQGGLELVDLPGTYSLSPYSREEEAARDFLLEERPGGVINVADGTNLERNLFLTLQLLEMECPVLLAVNMMDELQSKGWRLDTAALSRELGAPVVPVVARSGKNLNRLTAEAARLLDGGEPPPSPIRYDGRTEGALAALASLPCCRAGSFPPRFAAIKLLEGDSSFRKKLRPTPGEQERAAQILAEYTDNGERGDGETLLADARWREIERITSLCLDRGTRPGRPTLSDRIDRVATGRLTALPLFLLAMAGMFSLTFGRAARLLTEGIEWFFSGWLTPLLRQFLRSAGSPNWCESLLADAILGGIAGVLKFLPQIAILFFCLSLLEDSGYMARAAFLMDRLLRKLGLSGKSFIPMLMGFGCTTPAVMAARTLENEKDRRMTMMLTPFLSCGARLPIYALFAGIFFPERQGLAVLGMYLLGILVAILTGLLLKRTLFRGETAPFVMELPPYRLPTPRSIGRHVWEKCRGFIGKAGTVIFAMSVAIWLFQHFTPALALTDNAAESLLGRFGSLLAPCLAPLGFGTWQAAVALLTGLIAKESVVSTLTILYAGGNAALLPAALASAFSPASALAFMVFSLLYMPCISAFVTLKKEMGSLGRAAGSALLQTGVAYAVALLFYQIGRLLI